MRKTLAVVVLVLCALTGVHGPAHGGGPTSVLITQPSTGEATALHVASAEYGELERLLTTAGAPEEAPVGGSEYRLTWLIHDVQPWRHDSVRVMGDGTAVVATSEGSSPFPDSPVWRQVAEPHALVALLDRAFDGERSEAPQAGTGEATGATAAPGAAASPPTAAPPSTGPAADPSRWSSSTEGSMLLGLGGFALGLVAGVVAVRRRPRGQRDERQVLVDGPPRPRMT